MIVLPHLIFYTFLLPPRLSVEKLSGSQLLQFGTLFHKILGYHHQSAPLNAISKLICFLSPASYVPHLATPAPLTRARLITSLIAIGSQKISRLCLLDLSAAFDHWPQHLNYSTVICRSRVCLKPVGLTCHFAVSVLNVATVSLPLIPALVVFLKVLFLVLFSLCTVVRNTLIPSLSWNHQLYANDAKLFFFYPSDLDSSITHIQNALQQISSSMTANLLTLTCSKTEFLLIELKQLLAKINYCSFGKPMLLVILAHFWRTSHLFWPDTG